MERDKFSCVHCGDNSTSLQVHHLQYFQNPWDCPNELLATLCEPCHKHVEHLKTHFNRIMLDPMKVELFSNLFSVLEKQQHGSMEAILAVIATDQEAYQRAYDLTEEYRVKFHFENSDKS